MKTTALKRKIIRFNTYIPYPNALTGRQMLQRFLNTALVAVCGMGLGAAFLLIAVMFS